MNILLISANTETVNMPVLPLGLACVAAAVERAGMNFRVVSLLGQSDARAVLEKAVTEMAPDVIGISVRNIDDQAMRSTRFMLDPVKETIKICRSLCPAPIVLGGAGYSIFPEAVLAYTGADMGIRGEGESAFPELALRIHENKDLSGFPGLHLPGKKAAPPRYTRDSSLLILPHPGTHLQMPPGIDKKELWLPIQTRRGCPMDCLYCSTGSIEGRLIRKFSIDEVISALARFVDAGFDRFFFVDNTFNFPPAYAEALCDRIIAARLDIRWRCIIYPARLPDQLAGKMAKAGCVEVSLGYESGSDAILKILNKRFDTQEVVRTSRRLKNHGIAQLGFLMFGAPGETRETVMQSLHFADSLNTEGTKISTGIRIYPQTALADIAQKQGVIRPDDNLLLPRFYLDPDLAEWLQITVSEWIKDRPRWFT